MVSATIRQMSIQGPTESLAAAACSGSRTAFSALIERDRDLVYAYAFALLRNREDAEDAAQEAFVRAYLSLGRLRDPEAWEPWLMRIVRNLCHDRLRRKRVRRTEPIDPAWLDGGPSPEALAISAERRRELNAAVERLPDDLRVLVLMRFAFGRTRREIAAALGVPESTVMGRLARAVRMLRRQLGEEEP